MNRREFLKTCVAVAAAGPVLSSGACGARFSVKRPNIVLIMADDLGYECLSGNGSASYKTPVLDRLASTGVRFEHCYAQPVCTPSRVKIMTGRSNARNYITFGVFDFKERTFAHIMKDAGYDTCIVGKWQLAGRGTDGPRVAGFSEYCLFDVVFPKGSRYKNPKIIQNGQWLDNLEGRYGPDVFSTYILEFIERHRSINSKPFFLYYPMVLPHGAFLPTPDNQESWGQENVESNISYYGDMVAYMDKTVGRIVQKLDTLGLCENTLLLFTADNGTPRDIISEMQDGRLIRGGKRSMTDAGTHVPLIANWKGTTPAGKISSDLVDFSDFLPTIADLGGASPPRDVTIDGRSFLPQLRGEEGSPRDWVFCWYRRSPKHPLKRFARNQRWKLYDKGNYPRAGKLFDIQYDPLEMKSIKPGQGSPEAAKARVRLQAVLARQPGMT